LKKCTNNDNSILSMAQSVLNVPEISCKRRRVPIEKSANYYLLELNQLLTAIRGNRKERKNNRIQRFHNEGSYLRNVKKNLIRTKRKFFFISFFIQS